jgi:cardiolipin synthase
VVQGSAEVGWSELATVVRALLVLARGRVRITTAYFVPDEDTCELLCDTARRGVDVQLLLPGPHADKRFVQLASESQYQALLDAGVEVWAYQPSMLHAKVMTVDGSAANVGSANFNSRSLRKDEEVSLVVFDPELVALLDDHFDDDRKRSDPIDPSGWDDRGGMQRVKEAATSVLRREM